MSCSPAAKLLEWPVCGGGALVDCRSVPNGAISAARVYTTTEYVCVDRDSGLEAAYQTPHTCAHTAVDYVSPQEATRPVVPYLCFLCLCPSAVASAWPGSPASTTPGSYGSCRRGSHGTRHPQQLAATTADSLLLLNGCCNPCLCLSTHHLRLAGGHFHMHLRMPCCLTPLPLPPTIHSCPLFPSPVH